MGSLDRKYDLLFLETRLLKTEHITARLKLLTKTIEDSKSIFENDENDDVKMQGVSLDFKNTFERKLPLWLAFMNLYSNSVFQ